MNVLAILVPVSLVLGGLGLDDFYRYQAPLFRQRP